MQLTNSALATIPLIRRFSLVYNLVKFLIIVAQQGTIYRGFASFKRFKKPVSLTMLIGRISLAIISQAARVSFFAFSEDCGKGITRLLTKSSRVDDEVASATPAESLYS